LMNGIQSLLEKYEHKEKCGIFFNLNETKNPLDIIGVLDLLKYKIKNWGNTNIYSYEGSLFDCNIIIIVGSKSIDEAITISIFVYLSRLIAEDPKILKNIPIFENIGSIESILKKEFELNLKKGYPNNPHLEKELKLHLEKLLKK
jgi:hypothetical protein